MRTFFDSSAFAKRYIEENGSAEVEQICMNSQSIGLSSLCLPEIISALNRRIYERSILKKDYISIKQRLLSEIEDIDIINVTAEIISKTLLILEQNKLRTIDSIHIASALLWSPDLFISADKRQIAAAKKSGLNVKLVK